MAESRVKPTKNSVAVVSAKQQARSSSNNTQPCNNMMYGDIVIGLWWCIVVPIHGRDLWLIDGNDPLLPGARIAYLSLVTACILTLFSIFTGRLLFSRLAFLANIFAMSATNLLEFPFPGECAITPMMVGGTILGILANVSLPFFEKMFRLPVYFAAGSYVCIDSPYCSYADDTLPILGGGVLLEMAVLCVAHFGGIQKLQNQLRSFEMNAAHLARIVLAFLFLHHVTTTLLQLGYHQNPRGQHNHTHHKAVGQGWNGTIKILVDSENLLGESPPLENTLAQQFFVLVQAAIIACVGVAATGTFQEEIHSKERAEQKAKEESLMSKAMADSMMILTHELRTPLQGIMGATSALLQNKTKTSLSSSEHKQESENDRASDIESLKLIMASSSLLLNLINNMLDVKRVAEGMMEEFPLTLFPASEPIRDAIGFCLPLASISNIKVVADYGTSSGTTSSTERAMVRSNALRLQQVLINLISNAIKYANTDGGSEKVIKVSLRVTNVEDVDRRMKRALASSRPSQQGHDQVLQTQSIDIPTTADPKRNTATDGWASKSTDEKVLLFGVSDCGSGIDQVQANKLFRRFGRLHDSARKLAWDANKVGQPSGTGLGLHLCQLFVQRMGGQIWATNNSDSNGATFFFCLSLGLEKPVPEEKQQPLNPRILASTAVTKHKSARPTMSKLGSKQQHRGMRSTDRRGSHGHSAISEGTGGTSSDDHPSRDGSQRSNATPSLLGYDHGSSTFSGNTLSSDHHKISVFSRRVLFVDDTLINRKILGRMMKQIGCTNTCIVGSGQAALQELYKQRYDLVITDLQMPGMNGMELCEAIHSQDDEFFRAPIVVGLTADTSHETTENCKASGMSDVVHKPITVEELREFFERRISVLIDQNQNEYLEP